MEIAEQIAVVDSNNCAINQNITAAWLAGWVWGQRFCLGSSSYLCLSYVLWRVFVWRAGASNGHTRPRGHTMPPAPAPHCHSLMTVVGHRSSQEPPPPPLHSTRGTKKVFHFHHLLLLLFLSTTSIRASSLLSTKY
jgi:hypothetical protein